MLIGIIGAMDEELLLLEESLEDKVKSVYYGFNFIKGSYNSKEIVVVKSGIGKVNAALSTCLLIEKYDVDVVINTGSAGGISQGLKVGDVIIGEEVTYHDVDVTGFNYVKGQMAGMPEVYKSDQTLVEKASSILDNNSNNYHKGQIVSGDEFVNSKERIQAIKKDFPNALACEMEATAIAQSAYVLGKPFLIIRAVSDDASDEAAVSFDEFVIEAGRNSAKFVLELSTIL